MNLTYLHITLAGFSIQKSEMRGCVCLWRIENHHNSHKRLNWYPGVGIRLHISQAFVVRKYFIFVWNSPEDRTAKEDIYTYRNADTTSIISSAATGWGKVTGYALKHDSPGGIRSLNSTEPDRGFRLNRREHTQANVNTAAQVLKHGRSRCVWPPVIFYFKTNQIHSFFFF